MSETDKRKKQTNEKDKRKMGSLTSEKGCKKLAELTPLYSDLDIAYSQALSGSYEDLSYIDEDVCVIAGLKDGRISGFWRPMVALGNPKAVKAQMERLYNISNNIYFIDFLGEGVVSEAAKFLLRKGLAARPFYTQIIDLTKTEEELHADLRKSYKSLINLGLKGEMHKIRFVSNESPSCVRQGHWDILKDLHREISGVQTRDDKTWDIQFQQIVSGQAFAVLMFPEDVFAHSVKDATLERLFSKKKLDAGAFFVHNNNSCYYFSGKSRGDVNSHPVVWAAMLYAKFFGCKTFEMGEQIFYGDEKEVNISKFKAGFGGECYARLLIGE